jgi:hypothetical protein
VYPRTRLRRGGEVVQGLGVRVVSLYVLVDREQYTRERCAAHTQNDTAGEVIFAGANQSANQRGERPLSVELG